MWRPATRVCKWNKIINFVLSPKLLAPKSLFSIQIVFFTFYRKSHETNFYRQLMIVILYLNVFLLGIIKDFLILVILPVNNAASRLKQLIVIIIISLLNFLLGMVSKQEGYEWSIIGGRWGRIGWSILSLWRKRRRNEFSFGLNADRHFWPTNPS